MGSFEEKLTKRVKEMSFITQFKIEFLLPFTGCRNVFGKMHANKSKGFHKIYSVSFIHSLAWKLSHERIERVLKYTEEFMGQWPDG